MMEIIIAAVVGLAMSVLVLLVWRLDRRESRHLAGLARRMGLKFSRRDRHGITRFLRKRFGMRSRTRYGWVRDVMSDSKVRVFRCNEIFTEKTTAFSRTKSKVSPTIGAMAEAPDGPAMSIETSETGIRSAHRVHPHSDMTSEYRTRAVGAYLERHPAPYGLAVYLDGGTMFACYLPKDRSALNKGYADVDYRYLAGFAYDVFQTKMGEIG